MIEPIIFLDTLAALHRWQTWTWSDKYAVTFGTNIHVPFRNFGELLTFSMTLGVMQDSGFQRLHSLVARHHLLPDGSSVSDCGQVGCTNRASS